MKKILCLLFAIVFMVVSFSSCGSSAPSESSNSQSTEKESQFYDLVSETQEYLDEYADDIYRCWYDYVYEDSYWSVNSALEAARKNNSSNISSIETNNEKIKDLYSAIKDGALKAEVKAVMQAYNDYYALVMEVSGSFNSYSADKETYKKELSSALKDLSFEL